MFWLLLIYLLDRGSAFHPVEVVVEAAEEERQKFFRVVLFEP
jgi:hypothetical protein